MVRLKYTFPALCGLAFASCAAPKATVVEQPPAPKKEKVPEPVVSEPVTPALPGDELRVPDVFDLPSDGDFRATNPSATKGANEASAVISRPPVERPPTDPPSRVKPKE